MASVLIQVDGDISDDLAGAFPHLVAHHHAASTTLTGDLADQQEMLGVVNLLGSMGIEILLVIRLSGD